MRMNAGPSFINLKLIALLIVTLSSQAGFAKSFFWEVNSANSRVYLLGSVHVATADYYPLPAVIEDAFSKSEVLVVELDPTRVNQQEMLSRAVYPGTDNLSNHISKPTYDRLFDFLKKNGLPAAAFAKMRPGILVMTLSMAKLATMGYTPTYGIDMYFLNKARQGKPIEELETFQMQLDVLLNLPEEESLLLATLDQMDNMESMVKALEEAWKTGNARQMEKLMISDLEGKYAKLKKVNELMIEKRNVGMTKKIKGYLKSGKTYFVIVGAAHLVGNQGIVSLLKKGGYKPVQH